MIYDALSRASLYRQLSPRFALAFDYLTQFKPDASDGRVDLDGNNVFALVQSYQTGPAATRPFEAHRVFVDVQFVAAGSEVIYTAPLDRLQEATAYVVGDDAALYDGPNDTFFSFRTGDFGIFFPQDGHKPGCCWHKPELVKKVVVKVRL